MFTKLTIEEFESKVKADLAAFVKATKGSYDHDRYSEDDWFGLFADYLIDEEMKVCRTTSNG